jgi:drug/metabolite transporter (DMT)-like permease
MRIHSKPLAYFYLALSMSLVGAYVALSKPLAATFPVLLLAWLRFGIGAVAMLGWLKRPATEAPLPAKAKGLLFLESFFGNFLFTLCMITGVSMTSAVTASVTMATIPAAIALLSWLVLKERISVRVMVAISLAVLGIALMAFAKPDAGGHPGTSATPGQGNHGLGQLLLVGAVLCEAIYAVIGKKLTGSLSPKRIAALINLWGFVLTLPFGIYLAWRFEFGQVAIATWLLLLGYALAACVVTVWLWMTGLQVVPASQSAVFTVMLPLSTALVGVVFLGESLNGLQMLAFAIAVSSLALTTLPLPRRGRGPTVQQGDPD